MFPKRILAVVCASATGLLSLTGCFDNPVNTDTGKPVIITQPQDKAVNFGESTRLVVGVSGDTPMTFKWYKSNTTIAGAIDSFIVLRNVTLSDTGKYYVIIKNTKGEVTSETANLSVSGGEPIIGSQSNSDTVSIGDSISLFVQAAGNRPFTYKWFKDSKLITTAKDSILKIRSISANDLGKYRVIVSNSIGADTSSTIKLVVAAGKVFISESDFQSGLLEWALTSGKTISASNLSIYSDAGLKSFGGYIYIIEKYGADNVLKFDPSKSDESGVLYQTHLGDNWNPQDMEFISAKKAYVSNMNEPKITIFNPATGKVLSNIDISTYTFRPDSNSSPYANDLQLVGSDLYVLLQRRNGYNPGAPSLILKINTATDAVVDTIPLKFKNSYGMAYADGALYVSNPGSSYSTGDGAIEKVNLSTKAVSTVITETKLGGNPNQIIHKSGLHFYVQNYIEWQNTKVVEIDASKGTVVATLPNVKDAFGGIYYDEVDGKLYVGERDVTEMGIRVFKDNVQIGSTIKSANSLPPTGMVIIRE